MGVTPKIALSNNCDPKPSTEVGAPVPSGFAPETLVRRNSDTANRVQTPFFPGEANGVAFGNDAIAQVVSLAGFVGFMAYMWWASQRTPKDS